MPTCTFFGHRDCPSTVLPKLNTVLEDLIIRCSINRFLVGNQGKFDNYVRITLVKLKQVYPHISYFVVLAYTPQKQNDFNDIVYSNTIIPDGIEAVPRRFAISWRNKWMIEQSEYVITYITHSFGGAAQFALLAERKNKVCINIGK